MELFRNVKREKELVDQEVIIYRKEQKHIVDQEVLVYRKNIADLAKEAADDTARQEHTYHQKQETLGIEIAKLEAQKEMLEERKTLWEEQKQVLLDNVQDQDDLIESKDGEIERLSNIIDNLIDNLPEFPDINVTRR